MFLITTVSLKPPRPLLLLINDSPFNPLLSLLLTSLEYTFAGPERSVENLVAANARLFRGCNTPVLRSSEANRWPHLDSRMRRRMLICISPCRRSPISAGFSSFCYEPFQHKQSMSWVGRGYRELIRSVSQKTECFDVSPSSRKLCSEKPKHNYRDQFLQDISLLCLELTEGVVHKMKG